MIRVAAVAAALALAAPAAAATFWTFTVEYRAAAWWPPHGPHSVAGFASRLSQAECAAMAADAATAHPGAKAACRSYEETLSIFARPTK